MRHSKKYILKPADCMILTSLIKQSVNEMLPVGPEVELGMEEKPMLMVTLGPKGGGLHAVKYTFCMCFVHQTSFGESCCVCMWSRRWSVIQCEHHSDFNTPDYKTLSCAVWTGQQAANTESHALWRLSKTSHFHEMVWRIILHGLKQSIFPLIYTVFFLLVKTLKSQSLASSNCNMSPRFKISVSRGNMNTEENH